MAGVILAAGGWSGLVWLVTHTLPTVPNRWMFFALLHAATTGTALPFVYYLHILFGRKDRPQVGSVVLVRQAMWVGLFVTTCAWLLIPRLLSILVALVLAGALITIEALLRLREMTRWRPE